MPTRDNANEVRQAFEEGRFLEAIEAASELANARPALGTRLFVLYRPKINELLASWAEKILRSPDLFLSQTIVESDAPDILEAIQVFEAQHAQQIEDQLANHPGQLHRVEFPSVIARGLSAWAEDRDLRSMFKFRDPEALEEATEEALLLVKRALKRKGRLLKDYSREDMLSITKTVLRKAPAAIKAINQIMEGRRELITLEL